MPHEHDEMRIWEIGIRWKAERAPIRMANLIEAQTIDPDDVIKIDGFIAMDINLVGRLFRFRINPTSTDLL